VTPTENIENSFQKIKIVHSSLKCVQNITCGGGEKREGAFKASCVTAGTAAKF